MRCAVTLGILAVSLLSFSALTQQAPTTGSIEGIVVRADTEQPIANAQVTVSAAQIDGLPTPSPATAAIANAGAIAPVTTGADGKFAFKDLKPATYRVAATATGFVRGEYGQRALNGSGRLLFVVASQSINNANIRITPAGTVSGRILDENGQPAVGTPVQLLRVLNTVEGKAYRPAGTASVDDRGNYRIFGVAPGRYYLMAGTPSTVINLAAALRGGLPTGSPRYSVMYYPNVSRLDEAATIEVKAGNESSFDLHLKRVSQTFHVRGRVISPTGAPLQNMTMTLGFNTASSSGAATRPNSLDPATGTFDVAYVPPGEFTINVIPAVQTPAGRGIGTSFLDQQAQQAMGLAASVPVHVTNADIDGLVLTPTPGLTVQGRLVVDGQPISAVPNLGQLRVNIRNVVLLAGMGMPRQSAIATDGSFQVTGLREGEYRAQMSAAVPGFYVKSVKYGGEDVLGRTFKISANASGTVEVILRAGTHTIAGTVTDAQSQPVQGIAVVLIPAQSGRLDLIRITNTDQTGKFTMTDLAPGEYKAYSWEAVDNNAWIDPDFLQRYEHLGKAIFVTESSHSSVDVNLIPAQ